MGLALTLLIAVLLVAAPAEAAAPAASGRLLVGFKKGVSTDRQQRLLSGLDGRIAQRFKSIRDGRLVVVRPRSGRATDALRKRLARSSEVAYAEPDFFLFSSAPKTPDDPFYPLQYALHRLSQRPRHRRPDRLGHPLRLRQGGDPRHRDRHRPPRPEEQRLQERGQAEQRQGRRQERLRRRHLRAERDQGQGLGRGRQRPRDPRVGDRGRPGQQRRGRVRRLLVLQAARRQVHELEGQGLDLGRDRRHRLRGQAGLQDHQLLVRLELEVVVAARRRRLCAEPQHACSWSRPATTARTSTSTRSTRPPTPTRTSWPSPPRPPTTSSPTSPTSARPPSTWPPRARTSTPPTWGVATAPSPGPPWPRPTPPAWLRCCASRSRTPPTATCATRSGTRSTSHRALNGKVAYDGRLNAEKALAAIASIVDGD